MYCLHSVMFLIIFAIVSFTSSLRLMDMQVSQLVIEGGNAELSCHWQLDPGELLYSVKWYKDGNEFFRYLPREAAPKKFELPGVNIEVFETSGANLVLSHVELTTSGRYRCEVSGERPFFLTVSEFRDMNVVVPPKNEPVISGLRSKYRIGEKMEVNCTCGPSHPAALLTWYINAKHIDNVQRFQFDEGEMSTTKIALKIYVEARHFTGNELKIKCLATIPSVYKRDNEKVAIQDRTAIGELKHRTTSKAYYVGSNSHKIITNFRLFVIWVVILFRVR